MKKSTIFKLLFSAMVMFAASAFTACVDDNSDEGIPFIQVTPDVLTYELTGGTQTLEIKTNRVWSISINDEDKEFVRIDEKYLTGNGDASIPVSVFESAVARRTQIQVVLRNKYDVYASKKVTIVQGEVGPVTVIYNETFGTSGATASPYLFLDQYTDYVKTGEGAADVDYAGSAGVSARQSGKLSAGYDDASGHTKAFFGTGGTLLINKIALKSDQTNLTLNFGGSYSKNNNGTYDNTFYKEKFHVYLSADGTTWSNELEYTIKQADDYWVYASVNFSLKNPVAMLYVKMVPDEASVFAIDDPRLITSAGGQEVDLATGAVTVTTKTPTEITATGATFSGTVSTTEGVTAVGFQYAVNVSPIDWNAATKVTADAVAVSFSKAVTGLTTGTTYAVRAFATTAEGDVFGTVTTFTPSTGPVGDQIVTDFTVEGTYPAGFPISKDAKAVGPETYSFGGASYTLAAANTDGVYYRGKEYQGERYYLMIGKKGAYIELPAMAGKALTSVECFVPKAASANVQVGISTVAGVDVAGGAAITWAAQNDADRTYTYTLTGTAENTKYRLYITAGNDVGYNAQIYKLTLNYGDGTPAGPSISVDPASLSFTADADNTGKSVAVTVANQGAYNLYAESSDNTQFPTTLSGTTVTVKAAANTTASAKTATVKVYLATGPGMTHIAEQTIAVTQAAQGTTPSGDAYFYTNVGKQAVSNPYPLVSGYTDWQATGSGNANVTYTADGTISVRSTGKSSAGAYDGASGPNVVFFGTFAAGATSNAFMINNITVPSSQTKMSLSFGGSYSKQNGSTYDNAWNNSKFLVSLSSDGTTWTPITYTKTGGDDTKDPFWVYNTADFTLKSGVSAIYIKFSATEASVIRLDDIKLAPSTTGGQEVDLGGGGSMTPTVAVNPTSLSFTAAADNTGKTIAVTTTNVGANVLYAVSSDNTQFPTTLSGSTVTVKALANTTAQVKSASVKIYLAPSVGATAVAEQTVTVSQAAQGSVSNADIALDFTGDAAIFPADFPTAKGTNGPNTYQFGTSYNFTVLGTANGSNPQGYYKAFIYENNVKTDKTYLILGSQGAYIELPAISGKSLSKVVCTTTNSGAAVEVAITDASGTPAAGGAVQLWTAQTVASYTYTLTGTAANTPYRIFVNNAKNAQFTKLELWYTTGGSPATPNISGVNPTSLTWAAAAVNAQTIAVSGTDIDGKLTTSFSGSAFTATVNGTTVTVTPKAANTGSADITETLTISATGGNNKTVTLTQSKPAASAPNISGVNPTSLTWDADGVNAQTIAVSGTDISGKLTTSFSGSAFTASVSGTTVTVTPKAVNASTTTDVVETLTISATGGNNKTVTLTQSKKSSGGAPTVITMDFNGAINATPALPTAKQAAAPGVVSHVIDGNTWKFNGTESYYLFNSTVSGANTTKLLFGKAGSYIEVPAIAGKKLTKVEFTTPAGSSGKVTIGIKDAADAFVAGGENQTLATPPASFTYNLTGTQVNTAYRVVVTNANNAQFATLTLQYE